MGETLTGRRILVVGASSGVGRSLGLQAAAAGATVAFAARRAELVRSAAEEAGNGAVGLVCDARDPASCASMVSEAADALGGLDTVVYSTAIDILVRIAEATAEQWADTFTTNVFGAAHVTAAALPHVRAAKGRFLYISASSVDRPLPAMGVYASSKAALKTMCRAWQSEHPDVAFSNVRIGSALGTGVTDSWDRELLMDVAGRWNELGYVHDNGPGGPMTVEEAAGAVLAVVAAPTWFRDVTAVSDPGRA